MVQDRACIISNLVILEHDVTILVRTHSYSEINQVKGRHNHKLCHEDIP